jgi:hypothetical protein
MARLEFEFGIWDSPNTHQDASLTKRPNRRSPFCCSYVQVICVEDYGASMGFIKGGQYGRWATKIALPFFYVFCPTSCLRRLERLAVYKKRALANEVEVGC